MYYIIRVLNHMTVLYHMCIISCVLYHMYYTFNLKEIYIAQYAQYNDYLFFHQKTLELFKMQIDLEMQL